MEVMCRRRGVAPEPGGGAIDGGAGVQRGHAAHAGALCRPHGGHLHSSAVLRCWYGEQVFHAANNSRQQSFLTPFHEATPTNDKMYELN